MKTWVMFIILGFRSIHGNVDNVFRISVSTRGFWPQFRTHSRLFKLTLLVRRRNITNFKHYERLKHQVFGYAQILQCRTLLSSNKLNTALDGGCTNALFTPSNKSATTCKLWNGHVLIGARLHVNESIRGIFIFVCHLKSCL